MRGSFATSMVLLAVVCAPISVGAVSARANSCRIVDGGKYLKGAVSSSQVCAEIERAIAAKASSARYVAEITATSPSRLAAKLTVNGKVLPEHKFAVMDSDLSPESVQRFARALADEVAKASGR